MTTNIIDRAKQKLSASQQRLEEIQAEKDRLDVEVTRLEAFLATAAMLADGDEADAPDASQTPLPVTPGNPLPGVTGAVALPQLVIGSHAAVAAQLLADRGPLTLDQLLDAMLKMGRGVGDENFRSNVGSAIWRRRKDVFSRKDKEGPFTLRTTKFVYLPAPADQPARKGTTKH